MDRPDPTARKTQHATLYRFAWPVCPIEPTPRASRWTAFDVRWKNPLRWVYPLDHARLHYSFAAIADARDQAQAAFRFATKWGHLGLGTTNNVDSHLIEHLSAWRYEARHMAKLLWAWNVVSTGDLDAARELVTWREDTVQVGPFHRLGFAEVVASRRDTPGVRLAATRTARLESELAARRAASAEKGSRGPLADPAKTLEATRDHQQVATLVSHRQGTAELFERWQSSSEVVQVIEPLRAALVRRVNQRIQDCVTFHFDPLSPARFALVPSTLLAALLVLLGQEMVKSDVATERVCARLQPQPCGAVFSPNAPHQQYCSERCRQIQHYHQKKEGADHAK